MSTSASSFLPLLVVGVGIAATQSRWRNEHWKLWISHKIVKLRWMRHAPRLTAMAVATDSFRCFSKRWHIADVKNITGDDQAILIVDRNSIDIVNSFRIYVYEIVTLAPQRTEMAVGAGLAPLFFEKMTCCRRQKHCWQWPGNCNGQWKFRKYRVFSTPSNFTSVYVYEIATGAQRLMATAVAMDSHQCFSKRLHVANIKNIAGDDQDRSKFCNYKNVCLRDQARPLEKHLFAARMPLLWCHCAQFSPAVICNGFCSRLWKIISWRPWTPPKNRDIHIEELFL